MHYEQNHLAIFARTNFRGERRRFGIRTTDRLFHIYAIGKTGTGKSTLLETLMRDDVRAGSGFALVDPHGDLVERVARAVPDHRRDDVVFFDVAEQAHRLSFNPLGGVPAGKRSLAASAMLEVFRKLWADSWGPRLEHILRNALLALLDQERPTLADILRLLSDDDFRRGVGQRVENPMIRSFWLREYPGYPDRFRAEAIAPIQNKVGAFLSNPLLYGILNGRREGLDLRHVMDEGKILLVNLAKGKIGEDTANLLGSLLVSSIGNAAFSRADTTERERRPFWVYLDEFQNFTTLSLANMLSELRKYRVGLVLAHQYLSQLAPEIRDAIIGNVGTIISFRIGLADAEIIAREFYPEISEGDLVYLPNHEIYLKLMTLGVQTHPFSAETLPPPS
ncbi:MAG TPA: TraM recognition domain-containing protein [Candidatus Binatia bacterium]|nr:TraM recognition domain-containing protein [Candidatus Binatia bacterium]